MTWQSMSFRYPQNKLTAVLWVQDFTPQDLADIYKQRSSPFIMLPVIHSMVDHAHSCEARKSALIHALIYLWPLWWSFGWLQLPLTCYCSCTICALFAEAVFLSHLSLTQRATGAQNYSSVGSGSYDIQCLHSAEAGGIKSLAKQALSLKWCKS